MNRTRNHGHFPRFRSFNDPGIDEIDVFEPRLNGGMWGSAGLDGDNLREQKDSDLDLGCQK